MNKKLFSIGLLLLALLVSACGGLAGEPEIIGQVPRQNAPQTSSLTPPNIEADLALGAQIFAENCIRCHGISGAGDGEFVLSGQITDIPNFTDANFHDGRTAAEYYTAVTQGRIDKLMPPFSGSLNDAERWSVANYVFTLAGESPIVAAPITTEEASTTGTSTENTSPESTTEPHAGVLGSVTGQVINGTGGGNIPVGSTVTLRVLEMTGLENSYVSTVNADGSYLFSGVGISDGAGYRVSLEYSGGTFSSPFAVGTPAEPNMSLDVTIYETTDDASVLQINVVLTQIDLLNENSIQIWQMVNVTNLSDRLYISQNEAGRSVSVRVPVPEGVSLSPSNDLNRFAYDSTNNFIYDTRPVVPLTEHSFHLIYTAPFNGSFTISQAFDYEFFGPFEVYVDESLLTLSADGWTDLGSQSVNGRNYHGLGKVEGSATGQILSYSIGEPFKIDRNMIGYGLMMAGLVFLAGSGFLYWRGRNAAQPVIASSTGDAQSLMQEIAALDEKFEAKNISKSVYERERKRLKAQLVKLMKK